MNFLIIVFLLFSGCDSIDSINSEIESWLEESKAQRKKIERDRKALEDELDRDDLSDEEREKLEKERKRLKKLEKEKEEERKTRISNFKKSCEDEKVTCITICEDDRGQCEIKCDKDADNQDWPYQELLECIKGHCYRTMTSCKNKCNTSFDYCLNRAETI